MNQSVINILRKLWKGSGLSLLACLPLWGVAQHTLDIRVTEIPATRPSEAIYVSGNFNSWEPGEDSLRLRRMSDGTYTVSVLLRDVPSDRVEFKFTRGDWQRSESTADGRLEGPRVAQLNRDTVIECQIEGWRDDFPPSTASPNVHLLDSAFYIPQLDRHRTIWVYLPADYETSGKRYPVLYMHDGQHLFDEATSQGRMGPIEWGVDEVIDTASHKCIVVAINHQADYADRVPEFYYRPNDEYPNVEGPAYLAFIVETLKPYIDARYRTLPGKASTGIAGSSLGGLITLYASLVYPDVFGNVGVFSPSIWLDHGNIEQSIRALKDPQCVEDQRYYFYVGSNEVRRKPDLTFIRMDDDVREAIRLLRQQANPEIVLAQNENGRHGALYWREAFPAFYNWFVDHARQPGTN